jgi:hypothetical protein
MNVRPINKTKAVVRIGAVSRIIDVTGLDLNDEATVKARFEAVALKAQAQAQGDTAPHVQSRRKKMVDIGAQSVASRNRVFPNFPHVQASRKNQAYDGLIALLLLGRITQNHKIMVRHLKTGEYDEMTVGQLLNEVGDMYLLQLEMRRHDQQFRNEVNRIFKDPTKSDQEKAEAIERLEVPEFLDVDHEQSKERVVRRSQNGNANKS